MLTLSSIMTMDWIYWKEISQYARSKGDCSRCKKWWLASFLKWLKNTIKG